MTRPVTAETTARTIEELSALEAPWNALRRSHGSATPNADPHRFAATVEALGDGVEPHVTLLGEADDPRAIIVARRSTRKLGCRIGYLPLPSPRLRCLDVVYGGLITDGSEPAKQAVCDHLRLTLEARDVDHVMVNHLPTDHELFGRLSRGFVFTPGGTDGSLRPHWQFRFAEGPFENTLARFSRKHRYNVRRADRLLTQHFGGDSRLDSITSADDLDAFVSDAVRITDAGWQGGVGGGFGDPRVQRALLGRAAERGRLRCYALRCAGQVIAFQAGVVLGDVYHLQSTGFLPRWATLCNRLRLRRRGLQADVRDGVVGRGDGLSLCPDPGGKVGAPAALRGPDGVAARGVGVAGGAGQEVLEDTACCFAAKPWHPGGAAKPWYPRDGAKPWYPDG